MHWEDSEVTAYCSCKVCCGKNSPEIGGHGLTRSGHTPIEGLTAACDPARLGAWVDVPSVGLRLCEDTGSAVLGSAVDVYIAEHGRARRFGRKALRVEWQ